MACSRLVACSELSWLTSNPSSEPAAFWHKNYASMRSVTENLKAAEQLGYACLDHFTLPEHCWWDKYYNPWLHQIEKLKDEAEHDDFLQMALTTKRKNLIFNSSGPQIDKFRSALSDD
ncbi:MAG: hypothetical protein P4L53_11130 [Candidatus Obscuribacterales bacterium]|nr:hypothetical protein [Candidatus Obscuribacterales bacterium]